MLRCADSRDWIVEGVFCGWSWGTIGTTRTTWFPQDNWRSLWDRDSSYSTSRTMSKEFRNTIEYFVELSGFPNQPHPINVSPWCSRVFNLQIPSRLTIHQFHILIKFPTSKLITFFLFFLSVIQIQHSILNIQHSIFNIQYLEIFWMSLQNFDWILIYLLNTIPNKLKHFQGPQISL